MSDDFASRWSERRRAVARAQQETSDAEALAREEAERADEIAAEREANRLAAEAVDLDTIDDGFDMSVFMRQGVPDLLKRKALRALWRSSPVFANLDALNDYDENFRDPARSVSVLQSAWQAGRGYLFPDDESETSETSPSAVEDEPTPQLLPPDTDAPVAPERVDAASNAEPVDAVRKPMPDDAAVEPAREIDPKLALRVRLGL